MTSPSEDRQAVVERAMSDRALNHALLDQLEAGIYITDLERRILYWNHGAERISGYLAHEVSGHFCHGDLLMHCDGEGSVLCGKRCPLKAVMQDGRPRECVIFLRHRQGHRVPVHVRSRAIYDREGKAIGAVEIFEEAVAPARGALTELHPFGCLDAATGAANRKYGEMRVRQSLEALDRFEIPFGWLRVGLDKLEELEQRGGHAIVDAALKTIAATLDRNIGSFDVLTRWTRTEFRIEVSHCSRLELADLAEKLLTLVRASSVEWWGDRVRVSISIAAGNAERGDDLDTLESRVGAVFESVAASGGDRFAMTHAPRGEMQCLS